MKAKIEFDFPDEQEQFEDCINGWKWQHVVWQMDQYLRTKTKYANDSDDPEVINALFVAREELHRIINENEVKLR